MNPPIGARSDGPARTVPAVLLILLIALLGGATSLKATDRTETDRRLDASDRQADLLERRVEDLLDRMDRSVLGTVADDERELAGDLAAGYEGRPASAATARSKVMTDPPAAIIELKSQITRWSQGDIYDLEELDADTLNRALAEARIVANLYGLDVSSLDSLYELAKRTIREGSFEIPGRPPPGDEQTLSAYFDKLFIFAFEREKELAEIRARNQQYRVGLFKRATLAYLRALVAAADSPPQCQLEATQRTASVDGASVPLAGCPDPVIDNLRRYVDAIRQIQSADADAFLARSEEVVAQQQLAADFMAAVPLLSDAIDLYSLAAGEDLAGNCLSRFEKGITAFFLVIPIVGPKLADVVVEQAMKRSPAARAAVAKLNAFLEATLTWKAQLVDGVATRWGSSAPRLMETFERLRQIELRIELEPELADPLRRQAESLKKMIPDLEVWETLRAASENRIWLQAMPEELRERVTRESTETMARNLDLLQDRAAVVEASNMVESHVDAFEALAKERDEVLIFRSVNPDAKRLIEADYATKGMNVKGKSSDWGPQAGFIPVDQKFSKLGNPTLEGAAEAAGEIDASDWGKIAEFHEKVEKCLKANPPCAFKTEATLPGDLKIMTVPDPSAGREMPVLLDGEGRYLDWETKQPIDLDADQLAAARPMEVLADENLNPLTADYDFLAIGAKGRHSSPTFNPDTGYIYRQAEETLEAVNQAAKGAGYEGGNIAHHGAEQWYPFTPGAMEADPVVTVFDPKRGAMTIPRCDRACMQHWCDTERACGGLKVCGAVAVPPCIPVDPNRLLKDYFHNARTRGYNVDPNSAWNWGRYNVLGGWNVQAYLSQVGTAVAETAKRTIISGIKKGTSYLFACTDEPPEEATSP